MTNVKCALGLASGAGPIELPPGADTPASLGGRVTDLPPGRPVAVLPPAQPITVLPLGGRVTVLPPGPALAAATSFLESPRRQLDTLQCPVDRDTITPCGARKEGHVASPNPHPQAARGPSPAGLSGGLGAGPAACRQVTQVHPVASPAPGWGRTSRAGRTGPTLPWRSWSLSLIQSHPVWLLSQHLLLWAKCSWR